MLKVKIIGIDAYNFDGRDYFPEESDVGKTAYVLTALTAGIDDGMYFGEGHKAFDALDGSKVLNHEKLHGTYTVLLCIMEDGRKVELVQHEVEFLNS